MAVAAGEAPSSCSTRPPSRACGDAGRRRLPRRWPELLAGVSLGLLARGVDRQGLASDLLQAALLPLTLRGRTDRASGRRRRGARVRAGWPPRLYEPDIGVERAGSSHSEQGSSACFRPEDDADEAPQPRSARGRLRPPGIAFAGVEQEARVPLSWARRSMLRPRGIDCSHRHRLVLQRAHATPPPWVPNPIRPRRRQSPAAEPTMPSSSHAPPSPSCGRRRHGELCARTTALDRGPRAEDSLQRVGHVRVAQVPAFRRAVVHAR